MRKVLSLRYGVAFRKAFGDPEVFSAFTSDMLGVSIKVDKVEPEKTFLRLADLVKVEYDLFAEDTTHRIIVEVQHIREEDYLDRFLYYHLFGMLEQVRSHEDYRFARDVYTLVVLTRKPRKVDLRFSVATLAMDLVNERKAPLGAFRHKLVLVNPRDINDATPPSARRWMELIADSLDEEVDETQYPDPLFQRIVGTLERDDLDGAELAALKDEAGWENAKRQEREDGREEGREQGLQQGLLEALVALCEVLGVELTTPRREVLARADAAALQALLAHLKRARRWPEGDLLP
ncbi:MAG: PD-(D/E)XK nuclease family transposase [Deltaproteobacteria bacterium]|nr:PD-(D/E)XK nuclease family transposase [Deltaproteobacteria bacterium]